MACLGSRVWGLGGHDLELACSSAMKTDSNSNSTPQNGGNVPSMGSPV